MKFTQEKKIGEQPLSENTILSIENKISAQICSDVARANWQVSTKKLYFQNMILVNLENELPKDSFNAK